jgi:hypothetical protein
MMFIHSDGPMQRRCRHQSSGSCADCRNPGSQNAGPYNGGKEFPVAAARVCAMLWRMSERNGAALTALTSETSRVHRLGPNLPSAMRPAGIPCGAGGSARPATGHRKDRRLGDAATVGPRSLWPGTSRSRSALWQAHASCSSFRRRRAEHRSRGSASDPDGKTAWAAATERKALIFRALKHVFASAVCLTCHRGSYISRAPLGAYCGRSSVG